MAAVKAASNRFKTKRSSTADAWLSGVPESDVSIECNLCLLDPVGSGLERFPLGLVLGAFFAGFLGLLLG
jgi:hypothetical protein